ITIIDMGLHLEEALAMDLATEEFVRKKALPQGLVLNRTEREYFDGTPDGGTYKGGKWVQYYRCRRIELNALAADPDRFIEYVERKLEQHGCAKKLVPPVKVINGMAVE